jgi:hypothetical protein
MEFIRVAGMLRIRGLKLGRRRRHLDRFRERSELERQVELDALGDLDPDTGHHGFLEALRFGRQRVRSRCDAGERIQAFRTRDGLAR